MGDYSAESFDNAAQNALKKRINGRECFVALVRKWDGDINNVASKRWLINVFELGTYGQIAKLSTHDMGVWSQRFYAHSLRMNNNGRIILTITYGDYIYYRVGYINSSYSVVWLTGYTYFTTGRKPAIALNDRNDVLLAFESMI